MSDKHVRQVSGGDAAIDDTTISREPTDGEAPEVVTEHSRAQVDGELVNEVTTVEPSRSANRNRNLLIVAAVAVLALVVLVLLMRSRDKPVAQEKSSAEATPGAEKTSVTSEVVLSPEAVKTSGIEVEGVTVRPAVALLRVTGTVEANQQQMQQVTPLVGGRVERVYAALGDRVSAGTALATVSSPQIAQLHAKLHEAETHLQLAERNLQRVQRAENRVAVLQAKARLDEAEATLNRTRRLVELGAGAGKDLVAAETTYKTAKAEYDFQSNISLNKEVQEARAEVQTTRADISHIKDEMRSLGTTATGGDDHQRDTSLITLRAPSSGTISERMVNPGAGIEAGKPLFTIANLSTLWVMANVPEAQVSNLHLGTPAEVRASALGTRVLRGRVSYIDPQLDESTRTAHVRIDVVNPNELLKVGMFAEVGFQTTLAGAQGATGDELVIPSAAVQSIGDRHIVFIPKEGEPGRYLVRDVELGGETEGYRRVLSGLNLNDRIVTKGSFTLKTRLLRGELEEE